MLILFSSILYNLAFFFPKTLGFLIIFFWFPLYRAALKGRLSFLRGFLWGILSLGVHSVWLLVLLLTKSEASLFLSVVLYLVVILYLGFTCGLWLWVSQCVFRGSKLIFVGLMSLYFYLFSHYGLWFIDLSALSRGEGGYPFFSPLIPLISYKLFLKIIALVYGVYLSPVPNIDIVHLRPDMEKEYRKSPEVVGQRIYHKLTALKLKPQSVIVAPESTFPFDLIGNQEQIKLWSYALPTNAHLLMGGLRQGGERLHQSIYEITGGRITNTYDKTIPIPFVENLPEFWEKKKFSNKVFLYNRRKIDRGVGGVEFELSGLKVSPLVCSELFFAPIRRSENVIFCFVNDSWFIEPFREWMKLYAQLTSSRLGKPILYVGFFEAFWIKPNH